MMKDPQFRAEDKLKKKGVVYSQVRAEGLAERIGVRLERKGGLIIVTLPSGFKVYFLSYTQFVAFVEYLLEKEEEKSKI